MALSLSTQRHLVRIEVHADTICPWSYIMKQSLDEAIRVFSNRNPGVEFEVLWRPFYVCPELLPGTNKALLYYREINSQLLTEKIQIAGTEYGINFRIYGKTGNSRNSHLLIALALQQRGPQTQSEVVERLFRGYFEGGEDIADEDWLVQVGVQCGLFEYDIRNMFDSQTAGRAVDNEARSAGSERDVKATPSVTVQGRIRIGGYEKTETLEEAFERIRSSDYS